MAIKHGAMASSPVIFVMLLGIIVAASGKATIDPLLISKGSEGRVQSVLVSFTEKMDSVFTQIAAMNFTSEADKRLMLTLLQESFTKRVQAPLKSFLDARGVSFESFWINNKVIVQNADLDLVQAISNIPGVSNIEPEPEISLSPSVDLSQVEVEESNLTRQARQSGHGYTEWGIRAVRADQVWHSFRGSGVVVAVIDTGVRGSHESLWSNHRSDYGWYDATGSSRTPVDNNGHGTHVAGTIAGKNGIGVAPDAQWIACRACGNNGCGSSQLLRCGQWVQCPTRPNGRERNCGMAPKIVSNSWGSTNQGNTWFDGVIRSWHAAGIIPVFAAGNTGGICNTITNPPDRPGVIAVGNTDSIYRISGDSSRGPSRDGRIKPDISAPGTQIRSAWHTSDNAYVTISGTSMACPHVSGVIALMYNKNWNINYDKVYWAITRSANRNLQTRGVQDCGGVSSSNWYNNAFGHGVIDAPNALNHI